MVLYCLMQSYITFTNAIFIATLYLWHFAWGTNTAETFKILKNSLLILTNGKYNTHINPLCKSLSLLKIHDIYNLNVIRFYFSYRHRHYRLLPKYVISYNFTYRSNIHEHHTRSMNEIQVNKTKTIIAGKIIRQITPKIINKYPQI